MDVIDRPSPTSPPSVSATRSAMLRMLRATDRFRFLRRRVGRHSVGQQLAVGVALAPATLGFATSLVGGTPEQSLAFTEAPGVVLLVATLWCTPLAVLTGRSFVRPRKWFGIGFALCAVNNLIGFLVEHPSSELRRWFAIAGSLAVLLSLPLVATSTRGAMRRLGRRRWQQLHRATYVIAIAVVAHLWLVPQDDGPGGNIASTIAVALAMLLRVPRVRAALTALRRRRGGSLLAVRTWLEPESPRAERGSVHRG
jgi:methionine sulfoxide reductase heme-binding subunit